MSEYEEEIGLKLPSKRFILGMEKGDTLLLAGERWTLEQDAVIGDWWFSVPDKTNKEYPWKHIRNNFYAAAMSKEDLATIISEGNFKIA